MSDFTVLRVSIESDAVATALDALPGISVVEPGERPDGDRVDVPPERDTEDSANPSETPGDAIESPLEPDDDVTPAWREYGLLGVGASLVLLGVATVGIWWYRRRTGDETDEWTADSEAPAPIDPGTAERPPADVETPSLDDGGQTEPTASATADDSSDGQTVLGDEMPKPQKEPPGRSEDRDVEWTTRTESSAPEPDEPDTESASESDDSDTAVDPRDQVDVAPLLGIAFLAVSGAVVRWVQRAGDAE